MARQRVLLRPPLLSWLPQRAAQDHHVHSQSRKKEKKENSGENKRSEELKNSETFPFINYSNFFLDHVSSERVRSSQSGNKEGEEQEARQGVNKGGRETWGNVGPNLDLAVHTARRHVLPCPGRHGGFSVTFTPFSPLLTRIEYVITVSYIIITP